MNLLKNKPLYALAAYSKNNGLLSKSSSGAIFYEIAKNIINDGGIVYATAFDTDYSVHFIRAVRNEDLFSQIGSKYVQSYYIDIYEKIVIDLENKKK